MKAILVSFIYELTDESEWKGCQDLAISASNLDLKEVQGFTHFSGSTRKVPGYDAVNIYDVSLNG